MAIKYLNESNIIDTKTTETPINRSVSGYGNKIATSKMVKTTDSNRWRRVYCRIYGNSGSIYCIINGEEWNLHYCEL